MQQVGGGLEINIPRAKTFRPAEEPAVAVQGVVRDIGLDIMNSLRRGERALPKRDFHSGKHAFRLPGFRPVFLGTPIRFHPEIRDIEHLAAAYGQKNEHDRRDPFELAGFEFGAHVLGDEKTERENHVGGFSQALQRGRQSLGRQAVRAGNAARRLEPAENEVRRVRKERQRRNRIRPAKKIIDRRAHGNLRGQFGGRPNPHRGKVVLVVAGPRFFKSGGVGPVSGLLLQLGQGFLRSQRYPGKKFRPRVPGGDPILRRQGLPHLLPEACGAKQQ